MKAHVLPATKLLGPRDRSSRRIRRAVLTAAIACLLVALVWLQHSGLQRTSYSTGYVLYAAIIFLVALHWRKQAPSLPLGKVSTWLQYHIYIAYLAALLFGLHIGWRFPTGVFETALFAVFALTAGSGVYGLYLSRVVPRKLRVLPEEVLYECIPQLQQAITQEARQCISAAADATSLVDFYGTRLAPFIERPRSIWYFLYPNSRRRRLLVGQLRELDRFLNDVHRKRCHELERLLCRKDDLDFHAALQGRLKLWLFLHIGFSYSLLLLATVHGLLAHVFAGGAQ
jgi:hypothetical protein